MNKEENQVRGGKEGRVSEKEGGEALVWVGV